MNLQIFRQRKVLVKVTPGERCSNYVRRTGEATPVLVNLNKSLADELNQPINFSTVRSKWKKIEKPI